MGISRRPTAEPDLRRRYADPRPAAAQVPRRRQSRGAAQRRPETTEPVRPRRRRSADPHRTTQRRIHRPEPRRDHPDRRWALAAHPDRETPHRPLHPAAPKSGRASAAMALRQPAAPAQQPDVHRPRPPHPRTARRPRRLRRCSLRRYRPRHPSPTPPHTGHPSDQQRHEPGGHRRAPRPHLHVHDDDIRPDRRPNSGSRILRCLHASRNSFTPTTSAPTKATEGPNMRRLRAETTRLLGNGHCTRPAVLDCRYETICESCTHLSPPKTTAPP